MSRDHGTPLETVDAPFDHRGVLAFVENVTQRSDRRAWNNSLVNKTMPECDKIGIKSGHSGLERSSR